MARGAGTFALAVASIALAFSGCFAETGTPATNDVIHAQQDGSAALVSARPVTFFVAGPDDRADAATERDIAWDFGDGNASTGNPVRHTFAVPGPYHVTAEGDGASWDAPILVHLERDFTLTLPPGGGDGFSIPVGPDAHSYRLSVTVRGKDLPVGDVVVVLEDESGSDFRDGAVAPGDTLEWESRVPAHRTGTWGIGFENEDPARETLVAGFIEMTYAMPDATDA